MPTAEEFTDTSICLIDLQRKFKSLGETRKHKINIIIIISFSSCSLVLFLHYFSQKNTKKEKL